MPKLRLKIWHKFELLAALPMVACGIVLLLLGLTYTYTDHEIAEAQRAREALDVCEYMLRNLTQVTAKLWTTNSFEHANEPDLLRVTSNQMHQKVARLKELCASHPEEYKTALQIEEAVETALKTMRRSTNTKSQGGMATALKIMGFQVATQEQTEELTALNRKLAEQLSSELSAYSSSASERMNPFIITAALSIVAASAATAFMLNASVVKRLARLVETSKSLAQLHDVTEPSRVQGGDELADLEKVFHAMASSLSQAIRSEQSTVMKAADVICTLNEQGEITSINQACAEAWGYPPEAILGKRLLELMHPDDTLIFSRFIKTLDTSETMSRFEARMLKVDGALIHVLWACRKAEASNEIFAIAHDITVRKLTQDNLIRSEERFAAIKDRMPAAMIIINQEGTIVDCNAGLETLTERSRAELANSNIDQIIPQIKLQSLQTVQWQRPREVEILLPSGSTRTADAVIDDLVDEKMKPNDERLLLCVLIDTSDREELEKIKETLVAMIAHDIATPMTTIHSQLHLAQMGAMGQLNEVGIEQVNSAESKSVELMQMLTTVMKTAKYKHSTIFNGRTKTRLAELIDAAVESTKHVTSAKNIEIYLQIDRSLEVFAEPDSATHALKVVLEQMVNTCTNGGLLTIETFAEEADPASSKGAPNTQRNISVRMSHPRTNANEPPTTLAWEFATAILSANEGRLQFTKAQKFIASEVEFAQDISVTV